MFYLPPSAVIPPPSFSILDTFFFLCHISFVAFSFALWLSVCLGELILFKLMMKLIIGLVFFRSGLRSSVSSFLNKDTPLCGRQHSHRHRIISSIQLQNLWGKGCCGFLRAFDMTWASFSIRCAAASTLIMT